MTRVEREKIVPKNIYLYIPKYISFLGASSSVRLSLVAQMQAFLHQITGLEKTEASLQHLITELEKREASLQRQITGMEKKTEASFQGKIMELDFGGGKNSVNTYIWPCLF